MANRSGYKENHSHERINDLSMTTMDVVMKLSEGNPGAISVLGKGMTHGAKIDSMSAIGDLTLAISLDSSGIYADRIWMLYKDVCKSSLFKMMGVLRAHQLGFLRQHDLDEAIDNHGVGIDIDELITKVRTQVPLNDVEID